MTPEDFERTRPADPAEARRRLGELLAQRAAERGGHDRWARLAESLGAHDLALRELERAVRDEPERADLLLELAERYVERGRHEAAARLLTRLRASGGPADPRVGELETLLRAEADPVTPPREAEGPRTVEDAEAVRFLTLFRGREDVWARQWCDERGRVGYSPVRDPLTPSVIRNHLLGNVTVGVYPIRVDDTVRFFAVDLDLNKSALEAARADPAAARKLREDLQGRGVGLLADLKDIGFEPLFEDSGYKGRHYWVFLEQPEAAEVIWRLGEALLAFLSVRIPPTMHLEFFPRQPSRGGGAAGVGNLIKLPLGVHRKTGRRSVLLDETGRPLSDPWAALRSVRLLGRERLYEILEVLKRRVGPGTAPAARPAAREEPLPAGPPPPEVPPDWTEADFETRREVRHVLRRCPVLAELKRRAMEHRTLAYEEQLVLIHTLGHLPAGVAAVNYLLARCANVPADRRMKSPLAGNPMSCPKIRQRIGHVTSRVDCSCTFEFAPDRYPTPTLHLLTLKEAEALKEGRAEAPDDESLARRYAELLRRQEELRREVARTQEALVERLRRAPGRSVACPGGRYELCGEGGVEELRWVAEASDADAGGERAGR
ncbi:MAG TPA: CRISPR-associated primase-polymerase type A1 [Planctomycetota bacterium]|nr:CRISPR-associated primase-polymerase type A1 [Planctomycetota bacterium]